MIYSFLVKRIFDIVISLFFLVPCAPIIALAAISVKLTSVGPAFFTQERVGLHERPFFIFKIRTMYLDPKRNLRQTTNNDKDVLLVGRFLRKTKIDELPQIVNVLKGDMSFIGPRPCLKQTVSEMPEWARRRFIVRPGITGLAQTHGNVALTWEDRWKYDVKYVDNISFRMDLVVLLKTVLVVVLGEERFRRSF